jgi:hypothetical protein
MKSRFMKPVPSRRAKNKTWDGEPTHVWSTQVNIHGSGRPNHAEVYQSARSPATEPAVDGGPERRLCALVAEHGWAHDDGPRNRAREACPCALAYSPRRWMSWMLISPDHARNHGRERHQSTRSSRSCGGGW